jgi:hypothetical protein
MTLPSIVIRILIKSSSEPHEQLRTKLSLPPKLPRRGRDLRCLGAEAAAGRAPPCKSSLHGSLVLLRICLGPPPDVPKEPGPSSAGATTSLARLHAAKSPTRCAPAPWGCVVFSPSCHLAVPRHAVPRHEVLSYRRLAFLNWDALDDEVVAADTGTPRTWTSSCSSPRTQQLDIAICSRNITSSPCSMSATPRTQHLGVPSLRQLNDYSSFYINTDSEFLSAKEDRTCAQNIS